MMGLQGPELTPEEKEAVKALGLRHFILFQRNIIDRDQLLALRRELKALAPEGFLAVDQEGGRVTRIRPPLFPPLSSPLELASSPKASERVAKEAEVCAQALKSLGFNLNLAPVLDLAGEEAPDFLKGRTFGLDPEKVSLLGEVYVRSFLKEGVFCCAKHFPGLGEARIDPHEELPYLPQLREKALLPFKKAIRAGVPLVMTTHLVVESLDHKPATFSSKIVLWLREKLGFKGLILSDDLFMGAVTRSSTLEEILYFTLEAGHDLLLLGQDFKAGIAAVESLLPRLNRPPLKERVQQSLFRQKRLLSIAS